MKLPGGGGEPVEAVSQRSYRLALTEPVGIPHPDAEGITEALIRDVVEEFYRRARRDDQLGPIFEAHIAAWEHHLTRMIDFWSAALLRTGRYSGQPVERHRLIQGLANEHFARWVALFEATVNDLCPPGQADAFLGRAQRMREGLSKSLRLEEPATATASRQTPE